MDIIQGNLRIAKFLGYTRGGLFGEYSHPDDSDHKGFINIYMDNDFKWHKDWNYLMKLLNKLPIAYKICNKLSTYNDCWFHTELQYYNETIGNRHIDRDGKTALEATWNAITDFLEWYDNQDLTK